MDYTTVPRSLIYRERRSMEEFGAYEEDCLTRPLAEAMLRMDFIQQSDSESRALWCMNTAFYICTMVLLEIDPRWRLSKYKSIAMPNWNYRPEDFQILTLSLAGLLLSRLEESLPLLSIKGQARNHLISLMMDEGEFNSIFKQLHNRLKEDPHITGTIPNSTFAPRVIDKECIHDVMSDTAFNWVNFTKFWEERCIRDIVKSFGVSEDEKHNVIDMLRQSSHGFYSAGCNDRPEQVDAMLDNIDQEIHLQYNYEVDQTIEDDNSEQNHYLELKPFDEALFDSLKNDIARLHEEKNQETEKLKTRIAELEEENKRLAEQHGNQTMATDDNAVENLQRDLEHYKSMSETFQDVIKRYEDELGPLERLDDWKEQLTIKERIIFFQALTGCSLKGVDKKVKQASQTTKAKLIARFSGNNSSKIRSVINQLSQEIEEVENNNGKFSQGTLDAARNVYNYLHFAVEGATIGSKPYHCQIAMQTIDQTYHLNIDRAVAPPKDDNFLIEQEPKNK